MRDHNKAAGDLAFIVVQSDEDAQKLTDAAFSIEELQAELLKKDQELAASARQYQEACDDDD